MSLKTLLRATVMCLSVQAFCLGGEVLKTSERPVLLSHDQLQNRLSDPSLRVVDIRLKADYVQGHIPGAVWFDPKSLEPLAKDERPTDKSAWSEVLAGLGVGPGVEIVVYDDDPQHIAAARFWFFLAFASADREVGLVDGTFKSWECASRPVTTEAPAIELRNYDVKFNPSLIVGEAQVRLAAQLGSDQLVDARTYEEYIGIGLCPISKQPLPGGRAGHIPSAKLLDSSKVVDADGHFVDAAALRTPEQGGHQRGFSHNRLCKGRRPLKRNRVRPPPTGCPGAALRQGPQRLGDGLTSPPRQGRSAGLSRMSQA